MIEQVNRVQCAGCKEQWLSLYVNGDGLCLNCEDAEGE